MPWSSELKTNTLKMPLTAGRHYYQYLVSDAPKKEKKTEESRGNWGDEEEEKPKEPKPKGPKEPKEPKPKEPKSKEAEVPVPSETKLDPNAPTENLPDRGLVNYIDVTNAKLDVTPEKKE